MKLPIVADNSEWPESKQTKKSPEGVIFEQGEIASGKCTKVKDHRTCSGFRRIWLPYGYFDDPCSCTCHDYISEGYKSRLEVRRKSGHQCIGPIRQWKFEKKRMRDWLNANSEGSYC